MIRSTVRSEYAEAPPTPEVHPITRALKNTNSFWFTLYVSLAAFGLYTCVYAFRKPFAAATFDGMTLMGINYKVWLVTLQVCGYALSKFAGIRIVAELMPGQRSRQILITVFIAWASWLCFALIAPPFNILFLFVNGLALGLVWGMIFGFLEGRRVTEVLGAALSISFIFSSGLCRTVGAYLLHFFSETWMPFVASCVFFVPLLLFLFFLDKVPPPSREDELLRTKRHPMNVAERKRFLLTFLPGIVLFVVAYVTLTTFRDFRDNFSAEVWRALNYNVSPDVYSRTEVPVSIAILAIMGAVMLVKNNRIALMMNHLIIISGMALVGLSTLLFQKNVIDPLLWMTLIGLGLYMGYVPFNSIFFDRMLATFSYAGTVGFIMYVADAFGYLGSVGVLFFKEFGNTDIGWLQFLISTGYFVSIVGSLLMIASMIYFYFKYRRFVAQS